jgi:protein O-GlcNAc transferase
MLSDAEFEALAAMLRDGRHVALEEAAQGLIGKRSADGRVWQMLGVSYLARGLHAESLAPLARASQLLPDNAAIWDNLGLVHFGLKNFSDADACFRRCTSLQSDRLTAWLNWSASACMAGLAAPAETYARKALQLNPNLADGWLAMGNALTDLGRFGEAESAYRRALTLRPGWTEAGLSMGMLLDKCGRLDDAVSYFMAVLRSAPDDWRVHANLGKVNSALGRSRLATENYRAALSCNTESMEAYSGFLFLRLYEEAVEYASVVEDHFIYGRLLEAKHKAHWPQHGNDRDAERKIRLGFVSGDFREHAVAYFLLPFLRHLDTGSYEVVLYSTNPAEDEYTETFRRSTAAWVSAAHMSDSQLASRILADKIDILVDLAGHSSYNRLPVFARKPAPVQVSWLGYPATTGLSAIDYRPVYSVACPPGKMDDQFAEKVVYLPCSPCFDSPAKAMEVGPLPALRNGYITFASLNRTNKLEDSVIEAWCRILKALPDARLLVGAVSEAAVQAQLIARFQLHGVSADRLQFRPRMPLPQYLDLHNEIDILLDVFPFSGLATSMHAVWMGVPVLSLAGDALVKRQGLLVLPHLGLGDWVVEEIEEYVQKAVSAAKDLPGLADLRATLRARVIESDIAHPENEARCMAAAFREMWRCWCAGRRATSFSIPASTCRQGLDAEVAR